MSGFISAREEFAPQQLRLLEGADFFPTRMRDVTGRAKISVHQNIYDADFEYGAQPLRWETVTAGAGAVVHDPRQSGVRLSVTAANGDIALRQSRPYMRYQPGKTLSMASAVLMGQAFSNNRQRIGFFDDSNGAFFEQADATADNPSGMHVVVRSDNTGPVVDLRIPLPQWNGEPALRAAIDWTRIQMLFVEYAWYGAGMVRWGVMLNGQPQILHEIGFGNRSGQTLPWTRTGNLPVRYETRNVGAAGGANSMTHWGVSVMMEGSADDQRGFTYSYGMAPATPRRSVAAASTRFPVLSIRNRVMATLEAGNTTGVALNTGAITAVSANTLQVTGTPLTVNQFQGRSVAYGAAGATPTVARVVSNTNNTLTMADPVTGGNPLAAPVVGNEYTIGLLNRGQILPRTLMISADAVSIVELISSIPGSPVVLTGANWQRLSSLGSGSSFAERDVSATGSVSGGEVVFAFTSPAGGSGLVQIDLDNLFPLLNTVRGNIPDTLTVAVTTAAGVTANVGCHLICQEASS